MAADAKWMPINPEKPQGPQMAVITGNPKEGAFSALVKFPAGAATPLHSHPANFTGMMVSGTLKNGRSAEDNTAMGPGTLWTEPADEVHFTGCAPEADCIFVGHMDGSMGMTPTDTATEGELKVKVTAAADIAFSPINPEMPDGPGMFVLSGDKAAGAFTALVKFPGGATSPQHSHSSTYSAAVVSGAVSHGGAESMGAGSHWTEIGGKTHTTGCTSEEPCVFFAAMDGAFDMTPVPPPATEGATEEAPAAPAE